MDDKQLSTNLSWAEYTISAHHPEFAEEQAEWIAQPYIRYNAHRHAVDLWQPARDYLGVPLICSSGVRCPDINSAVGGDAHSAHLVALASDNTPKDMSTMEAFLRLAEADHLHFDQLIYEEKLLGKAAKVTWLHLGSPRGMRPRRQILMKFIGGGYEPFNVTDPRLNGTGVLAGPT